MRQVGYLLELYRDARSPEYKIYIKNSLANRDLIFRTAEKAYIAAVLLVKRKC